MIPARTDSTGAWQFALCYYRNRGPLALTSREMYSSVSDTDAGKQKAKIIGTERKDTLKFICPNKCSWVFSCTRFYSNRQMVTSHTEWALAEILQMWRTRLQSIYSISSLRMSTLDSERNICRSPLPACLKPRLTDDPHPLFCWKDSALNRAMLAHCKY